MPTMKHRGGPQEVLEHSTTATSTTRTITTTTTTTTRPITTTTTTITATTAKQPRTPTPKHQPQSKNIPVTQPLKKKGNVTNNSQTTSITQGSIYWLQYSGGK
ncbi:hypothetical protein E2C01_096753 [Portunus trituberculatus]|uniref:Uncharacterized protein n=1 Tax=Portunus trituberculatus TaxID=210409 RepID=A0A5B7K9B5_PORTR|nr:hypothetical protein [Portunus trituberculatus]